MIPEKSARRGAGRPARAVLYVVLTLCAGLTAMGQARAQGAPPAGEVRGESDEFFKLLSTLVTKTKLATKTEQTLAEAPSVIVVINREQLLQRNIRTVADALRTLPGIYVNYDYVFHDVGLRGIGGELRGASRLIKVMINGQSVSFRSETTNFVGPELIPIDAVERIEVIRGPGSALYGANAFLGVVNVVTRKGAAVNGALVTFGGNLFNDKRPGFSFGLTAGQRIGPFDFMFSLGRSYTRRDRLEIRCTTAISGEDACDYQEANPITRAILNKPTYDDVAQPTSFVMNTSLDLGAGGTTELLGNLQLLDSRGSFSDWGTLNYDIVGGLRQKRTGNRIALNNGVLRLKHEIPLFKKRVNLKVGGTYVQGGSSDSERLRDAIKIVSRPRYGYRGFDAFGEVVVNIIDRKREEAAKQEEAPVGSISDLERKLTGEGQKAEEKPEPKKRTEIIDRVTVLAGADYSRDNINFILDPSTDPVTDPTVYQDYDIANIGAYVQALGDFFNRRLGLVLGLRYDNHIGADVPGTFLSGLSPEENDRLCDGQVCYDQLSYRVGATFMALKDFKPFYKGGYVIDELFLKVLYGTAFKAPSPVFLYSTGFLGERPLNPNPALLPQTVSSLEVLLGSTMLGRNLMSSLTFFYNKLENKAIFTRAGKAVVAENGEPINSFGVEADLNFLWSPFGAYANFSWQQSKRDLPSSESDRIEDTFGYPSVMGWLGGSFYVRPIKVITNLELQCVGPRVGHPFNRADSDDERYTLDPYCVVNANIVSNHWSFWSAKETRVALSVRNLLDSRYEFPGFQPYYRYDVPGLPRMLYVTVSQEF